MTSSYWKIAIFLCPSLAGWSRQASIKVERIMKVNIQMFLPGSGKLHCCNYRARTAMMIGPETLLARGKLQYIPRYSAITCLSKLRAPLALPKHPSHGKNSPGSSLFQVRDQRTSAATGHLQGSPSPCYYDGWCVQWLLFGSRAISSSGRWMRDKVIASRLWWFVDVWTEHILYITLMKYW